jgi:hypothetical protein
MLQRGPIILPKLDGLYGPQHAAKIIVFALYTKWNELPYLRQESARLHPKTHYESDVLLY